MEVEIRKTDRETETIEKIREETETHSVSHDAAATAVSHPAIAHARLTSLLGPPLTHLPTADLPSESSN